LKLIDEANRLVFGHSSLRPGQRDIIVDTLSGVDVFVIMVRLAQ
jgi:superfamily II DNA helicase RecQ